MDTVYNNIIPPYPHIPQLQDVPNGEPPVLPPTADKIEVSKLKEDIPKFKQWISASSSAAWDVFLKHELQDLLSAHESTWVMQDIFKNARSTQLPTSETPQEVDPDLISIFEASLNPPCRVRKRYIIFIIQLNCTQ